MVEVSDDESAVGPNPNNGGDDDDDEDDNNIGTNNNRTKKPMFRGFLGEHGDDPAWNAAVARFPNGVPRFKDKQEGHKWTLDFVLNHGGSNPDFPHLIPAINTARNEASSAPKVPRNYGRQPDDTSSNIYEQSTTRSVMDGINFRLDLPFHQSLTPVSVQNTLEYLFFHMKCGIYVMIRDGKLRIFCPFANRDYRNTWHGRLRLRDNKSVEEYYAEKRSSGYREENVIDMSQWWANGNIICNEFDDNPKMSIDKIQVWGGTFLQRRNWL
jgi:hypothetical protein